MQQKQLFRLCMCGALALSLAACGGASRNSMVSSDPERLLDADGDEIRAGSGLGTPTTIWDSFGNRGSETNVQVNRYLWSASLEVLSFLPVESVDPFTGVIITGFGTPPGGSRAYRATILIDDPALNARSLNVSLQTRNAPADRATVRAVEDAILTRARQLRIADNRL